MSLIGVVLDYAPQFGGTQRPSLLTMPLGTGVVFDYFERLAKKLGCEAVHVVPPLLDQADSPEATIDGPRADEIDQAVTHWPELIARIESTDTLLIFDARYCLTDVRDLVSAVADKGRSWITTHVVVAAEDGDGTQEWVQCDAAGRVRRIKRVHGQARRPEGHIGVIPMSHVPGSVMEQDDAPTSLTDLRVTLAEHGALSRDLPTAAQCLDLSNESGYLTMNERVMIQTLAGELPDDYSRLSQGVLTGRGALIHESARLVPPVIVQPGALIEEGAWIIGPALIGKGSMIQRDAVVAQSILTAGCTIRSGATVRHEVCAGSIEFGAELSAARAIATTNDRPTIGSMRDAGQSPMDDLSVSRKGYAVCKRGLDIIVALVVLTLLSPLLALVAVLIKLDSRGTVFFLHRRERRDGKVFPCIKFRTMQMDAHRLQRSLRARNVVNGPQFKMKNDPRVTRMGRLIRATNIDELPQLFNVLLGHMSLVGPRPSPFKENQICVPWRKARLSVRPGITGLWQICRRQEREQGDFQEWIFYDTTYVRHMSLWLDLKILVATALTMGGRWQVPFHWLIPGGKHQIDSTEAGMPPPIGDAKRELHLQAIQAEATAARDEALV